MEKIFIFIFIFIFCGYSLAEDASTSELINRVNGSDGLNHSIEINVIGAITGGLMGEAFFVPFLFHLFLLGPLLKD
jgi:hypothetical protein